SRFQILRQQFHRFLAVGSVVQHAHAVNAIKGFGGKRKREYVSLQGHEIAVRQVFRRDLGGRAEVDANYASAPASRHFGESPHATSHVQHELTLQVLRPQAGFVHKIDLVRIPGGLVQLGSLELLPLVSEAVGIVALLDKTKNTTNLGKLTRARSAGEAAICLSQWPLTDRAAQQGQQGGLGQFESSRQSLFLDSSLTNACFHFARLPQNRNPHDQEDTHESPVFRAIALWYDVPVVSGGDDIMASNVSIDLRDFLQSCRSAVFDSAAKPPGCRRPLQGTA